MRMLEKNELSEISGGLNLLIKVPAVTAAVTLAILYFQDHFDNTFDNTEYKNDLNILPAVSVSGWDDFLITGQVDKKPVRE